MIFKAILGKDYKHLCETGDGKQLSEIFQPYIPPKFEIVKIFRTPCPISSMGDWIGLPTDVWTYGKKGFITLSYTRTHFGLIKSEDEKKYPFEIESVNEDVFCGMLPANKKTAPIGVLIVSNHDPATNYRHSRDVIENLAKEQETLFKRALKNQVFSKTRWNNIPVNKTVEKDYLKIAVEPLATWVFNDGDFKVLEMKHAPGKSAENDAFLRFISETNNDYLRDLVKNTGKIMHEHRVTDNYVIEIEGYLVDEQKNLMRSVHGRSEKKYAITVYHNDDDKSDYSTVGMILKMDLQNQNRYTISSILEIINKGVNELKLTEKFESWSDKMFKQVTKKADTIAITHTKPYNKLTPRKELN